MFVISQDDYTQAGNLWRIFSEEENRTAQAIAGALSGAQDKIFKYGNCATFSELMSITVGALLRR
ncbi:catalase-related domain-containing protein [Gloeocapsopsis crepidinum]|uniref:catalase-related domain-containing protein n=1 Tax=Gloeocapsopsis crepidinum TaxID=693223 RepID=UPI002AD348EE|nr:catalase-related domain-containing protein [Gloeocapsopsis crepidinum]